MTSRKLMTMIEELTKTPLSEMVLLQFLSNCENTILADVFLAAPENCKEYTEVTENELLVPHPFDKLYLPYMQAQIYHAAGEFMQYQNFMDLYNEYRDEYARYILSNVHPAEGQAVGNGYFLTAYAIAVAHGFQGSESEWLAYLRGKDGKSAYDFAVENGYEGTREAYGEAAAAIGEAVRYTQQDLSADQAAKARENIGAVSEEELEAKQTFLPVAKGMSADGIDYTATDEASETTLPVVSVANSVEHISAEGKGRQIVFIPYETNMTNAPTLQINGGQVIPIRMRAPKNQGSHEQWPDATLPVPVGALMRGVPYTMTFCGKYWLVDSLIDLHPDAVTEDAVGAMIAEAIGDTAGALSDMDLVIGGAEA